VVFGAPGIGTTGHLSGELFKTMAGIDLTFAAFKGSAMVLSDLLTSSGISIAIDNLPPTALAWMAPLTIERLTDDGAIERLAATQDLVQ
jgi:tripartite-type tricarboxylate transporter receptor subunit TctC